MKMNMRNEASSKVVKQKHVPARTCIGCRTVNNKRDMIRIVRIGDRVEVDSTGKKSGRGAYLCPYYECWELGLKGNRLNHSLHISISPTDRQSLIEFGKTLPKRK